MIKFGNKNNMNRGIVGGNFKAGAVDAPIATINTSDPDVPELNLGDIVAFNTAITMKNLATSKPLLGIETSTDPGLKKLLDRSDFVKIYPRLELALSYEKGSALLALVYLNKTPIIVLLDGRVEMLGPLVTSATGMTTGTITENKTTYRIGYEWKLNKKGLPTYRIIYKADLDKITIDGSVISTTTDENKSPTKWRKLPKCHTTIPVEYFENMEYAIPDKDTFVKSLLANVNFHGNQTKKEWEYAKIQLKQNGVYDTSNLPNELAKKIEEGQRIHTGTSTNGNNGTEPFMLGSPTLTANMLIVDTLEDKATKYLFGLRDSVANGTNKHNTEIATFNQVAAEMVLFKMARFRNKNFERFFKKHVGVLRNVNIPKDAVIKMQLSTIEDNKLKAGDPMLGVTKGAKPAATPKDNTKK